MCAASSNAENAGLKRIAQTAVKATMMAANGVAMAHDFSGSLGREHSA